MLVSVRTRLAVVPTEVLPKLNDVIDGLRFGPIAFPTHLKYQKQKKENKY